MAIVGTLPNILTNGTTADASQVMADLNFIVNQVNANAVPLGTPQPGQFLGVKVFTANGTYTPDANMKTVVGVAIGGGAGGGGGTGAAGGNVSVGAPGGAGSWAQFTLTAIQVGASQVISIGAGGIGGPGGTGANGAQTTIGALLTCPGGLGGGTVNNIGAPAQSGNGTSVGGGVPTGTATILATQVGSVSYITTAYSSTFGEGGAGGASAYGPGGVAVVINTNGANAVNFGSGGSGTVVNSGGGTATGGNGKSGLVILFEYA